MARGTILVLEKRNLTEHGIELMRSKTTRT
jgi:hypothetical protein